jgi:hypothetical protein
LTRWIHGISRDLLRAAFGDYFGVAGEHADILMLLYERPGERITTRKMQVLLNSHRPPKRGTIHERVRVLREIMEPESLDSCGQLDDGGYQLTEIGLEECRKALRQMALVLTREGPEIAIPGRCVEMLGPIDEPKALPAPESAPLRTALKAAS